MRQRIYKHCCLKAHLLILTYMLIEREARANLFENQTQEAWWPRWSLRAVAWGFRLGGKNFYTNTKYKFFAWWPFSLEILQNSEISGGRLPPMPHPPPRRLRPCLFYGYMANKFKLYVYTALCLLFILILAMKLFFMLPIFIYNVSIYLAFEIKLN